VRLTRRRLNRATLARQLLLQRTDLDVVSAVSQLGGLQAQEPASPYLALWARLGGLSADDITAALQRHELVKATLGRSTLHIVSATDYQASVTALLEVTRTKWMTEQRGLPVRRGLPELAEASVSFAAEPRTNVELRRHAGTLGEPVPADELWRRIRRYAPFLHVPTDEPWAFGRRPVQIAARAWLGQPDPDEDAALEHLVRSYLHAFGPARMADISQWSGLAVGRLKVGLARIEDIERYEDADGRELFDLWGLPLPDEDAPAPPRLLPMWDEMLLAYADRSRIIPEAYRKRVIVKAGDILPTFTVDGFVAGLWWAEMDQDIRPRIVLEPFQPVPAPARTALDDEATSLADFIADREPAVYLRYRNTARRG